MSKLILAFCFFIAIILETTVIQVPLTLLLLLIITIMYKSEWVFVLGLFSGLLIDGLSFRHLGETSLFYIVFLLFIFLYEQKFELRTIAFSALMSFIGGLFYFLIFGYQEIIIQLIMAIIIGIFLFFSFDRFFEKQNKSLLNPV